MPAIDFSLPALNRSYTLDISGALSEEAPVIFDVSATAFYKINLVDMHNVFKYESDSFDVNDLSAADVKYYVYMNAWPLDASLNPAHAYMAQLPTTGAMLQTSTDIVNNKNLVKHDYVRYLAKHLFNTPYGVDLFSNEDALLTDIASKGRTAKNSIMSSLNLVNQASASSGTAPNKYSTNELSDNSNICRELMRQIASVAPARFNGATTADASGNRSVPLETGDTINFKLSITAAHVQENLTGRGPFDVRVYKISLVIGTGVNVTPVDVTATDLIDYIVNTVPPA
jgi:hypothetical protein